MSELGPWTVWAVGFIGLFGVWAGIELAVEVLLRAPRALSDEGA